MGVAHSKIRQSETPSKSQVLTKSVVSFLLFPVSIREVLASKELAALKHGTKMNRDNKSAS